jgi:NADPH2:quinone reductase
MQPQFLSSFVFHHVKASHVRRQVNMKAWLLESPGGLSRITLGETNNPAPKSGEVILRVTFAALNPADRYLAEGMYPAKPVFPHILGRDGMGVVESVGHGVDQFKPGDKAVLVRSDIGINLPGTFAEKVAVPAESLVKPETDWSDEQSAGSTLVYLTALQALTMWGEFASGIVLITGASGGVGGAAIHLAKAVGHTVVGLSRDAAKSKRLLAEGADFMFDPTDTNWRKKMRDALGGKKVDLAIDNIGSALFNEVVDSLGYGGKVSCVGRLAGPVPQFNTASLFFRRIRIGGVQVGDCTPTQSREDWRKIVGLLKTTGRKPLVDSIFPFEKLMDAFEHLAKGPMGKVLLKVL